MRPAAQPLTRAGGGEARGPRHHAHAVIVQGHRVDLVGAAGGGEAGLTSRKRWQVLTACTACCHPASACHSHIPQAGVEEAACVPQRPPQAGTAWRGRPAPQSAASSAGAAGNGGAGARNEEVTPVSNRLAIAHALRAERVTSSLRTHPAHLLRHARRGSHLGKIQGGLANGGGRLLGIRAVWRLHSQERGNGKEVRCSIGACETALNEQQQTAGMAPCDAREQLNAHSWPTAHSPAAAPPPAPTCSLNSYALGSKPDPLRTSVAIWLSSSFHATAPAAHGEGELSEQTALPGLHSQAAACAGLATKKQPAASLTTLFSPPTSAGGHKLGDGDLGAAGPLQARRAHARRQPLHPLHRHIQPELGLALAAQPRLELAKHGGRERRPAAPLAQLQRLHGTVGGGVAAGGGGWAAAAGSGGVCRICLQGRPAFRGGSVSSSKRLPGENRRTAHRRGGLTRLPGPPLRPKATTMRFATTASAPGAVSPGRRELPRGTRSRDLRLPEVCCD